MKGIVAWSGGRDSCYSLWRARQLGIDVTHIIAVVRQHDDWDDDYYVTSSGVPVALLQKQADSIGVKLELYKRPKEVKYLSMDTDEFAARLREIKEENGLTHFIQGQPIQPLGFYRWYIDLAKKVDLIHMGENTFETAEEEEEYIRKGWDLGFRYFMSSGKIHYYTEETVDSVLGRKFDLDLLDEIKASQKNEDVEQKYKDYPFDLNFHTLVYDGPIFSYPLEFTPDRLTGLRAQPDKKFYLFK